MGTSGLGTIINFISSIFATLVNTAKGTVELIGLFPQISDFFNNITAYVPSFLTPFIICELFITFVLIIFKRKSQ